MKLAEVLNMIVDDAEQRYSDSLKRFKEADTQEDMVREYADVIQYQTICIFLSYKLLDQLRFATDDALSHDTHYLLHECLRCKTTKWDIVKVLPYPMYFKIDWQNLNYHDLPGIGTIDTPLTHAEKNPIDIGNGQCHMTMSDQCLTMGDCQ